MSDVDAPEDDVPGEFFVREMQSSGFVALRSWSGMSKNQVRYLMDASGSAYDFLSEAEYAAELASLPLHDALAT